MEFGRFERWMSRCKTADNRRPKYRRIQRREEFRLGESIFVLDKNPIWMTRMALRIYGLRFKIELSFKQALHVIGAYAYHFWMAAMTPLRRVSGNQYLHRKPQSYRDGVRRKMAAYHRHMQLGLIAQGLLQILSATVPQAIWRSFGSWIRTIRPGLAPSEQVAAIALRNTLPDFLADPDTASTFVKFLQDRIDLSRAEGTRLVA